MELKAYGVLAERSGGWWAFSVVGVDGANGQAEHLDQVEAEARSVISMMENIETDSFEIKLFTRVDPSKDVEGGPAIQF